MLFNSLQFAIFFLIVYSLYLGLNHKWQNRMFFVASSIFYGAWDWRFLSLLYITSIIDFICGIKIFNSQDIRRRKLFLTLSIVSNMAVLGFFKYFDFFISNLNSLFGFFGIHISIAALRIILPVGISFYTFQAMSYTIDVYRGKLEPTRNLMDFILFVTFFPQLVAGPIERASHLLPQVLKPRKLSLDKFYEGCYLILWGLFLKMFVADNLARIVNPVFASGPPYEGMKVLVALYAFAFQIYGDFAGYSSIARGLGKCMGFEIMINFNLPYFSTNPSEFWRRWHISLSSWLRDYLYIPLGGNRKGIFMTFRNIMITMFLGGLWHGAKWTFVIWGIYHGVLLVAHRLLIPLFAYIPSSPKNFLTKRAWFIIRAIFFFHLTCLGWLLFRAQSMQQVFSMLQSIFFNFGIVRNTGIKFMASILWLLIIIQLIQYWKNDLMFVYKRSPLITTVIYAIMFYSIAVYSTPGYEFIYFQF